MCICGLDSQGSNQPCGHPWNSSQQHRVKDTDQSPHPSLRPQLSPLSLPRSLPAGRPPSSHQLQPIPCSVGSCLCDPGGGLSRGGQRWLSTLLPMAPLRSLCTRSPAGAHRHDPWTVRGKQRTPPLLFNNGCFNHSNIVGCLSYCNYLEFGYMFLTSFHIRMTKRYVLSLVAVVQALKITHV